MMPGKHAAVQCTGEGRIVTTCSCYDCVQPNLSTDSCCWWPVHLLPWTVC